MFKKLLSMVLCAVMVLGMGTTAFASVVTDNDVTVRDTKHEIYDIIDTPEWLQMNRLERGASVQLSPTELQILSTSELTQVVLDYPFFIDILASSTSHDGFLHLLSESTALHELINREDISNKLIEIYSNTPVVEKVLSDAESNCVSNLWKLEILLAQPEIASKMNESQVSTVLEIAQTKYREKANQNKIYSGLAATFFESIQENSGASTYAYTSYVQTPKGNNVEVFVWQSSDGDFSSAEKS